MFLMYEGDPLKTRIILWRAGPLYYRLPLLGWVPRVA